MTDIVERLRDADNSRRIGESYADTHERRQRDRNEAADEIERLKAEVSALNHAEVKLLVQVDEQDAEITRLRAALDEAQHAFDLEIYDAWRLREAIKCAIRQHEEGNKGLAHRTLCEAVYGPQA